MKAVLLAAGAATRMRPLTDDTPKCLLPVAGVPILERTMVALMRASIRRFVIVTGYLADHVSRAVSTWNLGADVELVRNEVWSETNNAYPAGPRSLAELRAWPRGALSSRVRAGDDAAAPPERVVLRVVATRAAPGVARRARW